ncbi:MAG: hypothetical protein WCS37_21905, partial [Chloroflexota bacterium]
MSPSGEEQTGKPDQIQLRKPRQLSLSDVFEAGSNQAPKPVLQNRLGVWVTKPGRLKIFLGAAAGVGKTYAMLEDGQQLRANGIDIAIGYVELHGRKETERLLKGFEIIPYKQVEYRETSLEDMDTAAILQRHPQLVLVDELAHTNAPGSERAKRYEDIEEILANGMDVHTTVNIQHLESLNDRVFELTGTRVREPFPDRLLALADEVVLIDLPH